MCEGCAFAVNNWFYGYQVWCTEPTQYWLNIGGYIVIFLLVAIVTVYFTLKYYNKKELIE